MTEWNTNTNSFQTVDQWVPGMPIEGGQAPGNPTPPGIQPGAPSSPPQQGQAPSPPSKATMTLQDLEGLWHWAVRTSANSIDWATFPGDAAGAMERAAVTLFMDARKQGLTDGDGIPI
jgi:hypothetical protein